MYRSWLKYKHNIPVVIPVVFWFLFRLLLWGDFHQSQRDVETLPGTAGRIENIVSDTWYSTSNPTTTNQEHYGIAKEEYAGIRASLDALKTEVQALEAKLDSKNIPYTPNHSNWKEE